MEWTRSKAFAVAVLGCAGAMVWSSADAAGPKHFTTCDAAHRDQPTLDRRRLPSARFRMVTSAIGWEPDASGKGHDIFLRHGEESAQLKHGVRVRITLDGCETYSNLYEFVFPGVRPKATQGAYWLQRGSEVLRELAPANMDEWVTPLMPVAEALAREARQPDADERLLKGLEGSIDDQAKYSVEIKQRSGKTTLIIKYWFNL